MNETSSPDPHEEDAFVHGNDEKPPTADDKVGARQELSADDTELPIRKLKLETEILARQLKPRYFLLEVAKAIAGPVAVLGLMWTIVVGISQQGALQQSKEDERFDKAVTRLAGPSPTERLTGLAGLQLFLEPEYKSRHRGTLSFLVNALASESDATVRGALLDTFSRLTRLDVNQSVMNETLERLRDQNRSLLALRKDPSLATAKGNDETGMGQLSQEDLAPLRATATAIAVLIRHGAVTQDLSEIYCESCDFSGKTLDMSRPDYANTANFAQWHGADLSETDFHNAILKNANFTGLFLRGASFDSADLIRAKFAGADLQGAKLTDFGRREYVIQNALITGYSYPAVFPNFACSDLSDSDFTGSLLFGVEKFQPPYPVLP